MVELRLVGRARVAVESCGTRRLLSLQGGGACVAHKARAAQITGSLRGRVHGVAFKLAHVARRAGDAVLDLDIARTVAPGSLRAQHAVDKVGIGRSVSTGRANI